MGGDARSGSVGLRLSIAAVAAIAVGVVLTVGGLLLVGLLRSRLESAAQTSAALRARDVAALAVANTLPRQLAFPGEESGVVQVVAPGGAVLASTANIEGEPPITSRRPSSSDTLHFTMNVPALGDARRMSIAAVTATTPDGQVVVYAGESLDAANETIRAVAVPLGLGLPVLVGVVAAVTWWAVGRTLRPVRAITHTMAEITASDLHRRVPSSTTRDEIGRLADTVNATLTRLDASIAQQRRFVADASHELRGPLAALRADLEISVAHPERTTWATVAADSLGDVERLQHLTDNLLLLARLDSHVAHRVEPVDLVRVADDTLGSIRRADLIIRRPSVMGPVIVHGDRVQLMRMMRNLIHNAERYAATAISVDVACVQGRAIVTVADDGPGIPSDQRARVFERFVRLDAARTSDGGTGLGLAIVHDVVAAHHGSVTIGDAGPRGATLTVELPSQRAGPSPR